MKKSKKLWCVFWCMDMEDVTEESWSFESVHHTKHEAQQYVDFMYSQTESTIFKIKSIDESEMDNIFGVNENN